MPGHAATTRESDGAEPELGGTVADLDVYVDRFRSVARVEEESEPPYS